MKIFMEKAATLGIDLNTKDNNGLTGFDQVCQRFDQDLVKMFFENATKLSFDLNAKDNMGWTAFHSACELGFPDVVKSFEPL